MLGAVAAVLAACSLMSGCRPGTAAAMTTAAMTGAPSLIGTPIAKRTVLANLPSTAQARRYGWSTATRRQVRSFAASLNGGG